MARARASAAPPECEMPVYDPLTHTSRLVSTGTDVPHVTAIIGAVGVGTDFDELCAISPRLAARINYKRDLGSAFHADSHAYDDGELDWATVHPDVRPYDEAWATARENLRLRPLAGGRERYLYHPLLRYAGITDGVFVQEDTLRRILADLKTGDPEDAAAHLQTAAYEAAWNYWHPDQRIDERWAIQILPGRRQPYVVTNYTAVPDEACRDFPKWQACVTVYYEHPERRARRR